MEPSSDVGADTSELMRGEKSIELQLVMLSRSSTTASAWELKKSQAGGNNVPSKTAAEAFANSAWLNS